LARSKPNLKQHVPRILEPLLSMKTAAEALAELERERNTFSVARLKVVGVVGLIIALYVVAGSLVHFDLGRLAKGLPRIAHWLATAWPPKFSEMPIFLWRTAETIAMAAIGTTLAVILALPLAVFASHNLTPLPPLYLPIRWFLNALRGIDSFVFALLFVAAVGLGPFAGVLGIALHTTGTAAKFFADQIESSNLGPYEAIRATGAGRLTAIAFALVPDLLPLMLSTALFWWEFNVRASTVLGVVGAGGIGQELKNSLDLLDFSRLFTIIAVILVAVTAIDSLSGWLRKRLV
jgi:phosphonate transport system permease protein